MEKRRLKQITVPETKFRLLFFSYTPSGTERECQSRHNHKHRHFDSISFTIFSQQPNSQKKFKSEIALKFTQETNGEKKIKSDTIPETKFWFLFFSYTSSGTEEREYQSRHNQRHKHFDSIFFPIFSQ